MGLLDVHAHYDTYLSKEELEPLLKDFSKIILNGIDRKSNEQCISYASEKIAVALGYHPLHITTQEELDEAIATIPYIREHAEKIVAIGEIGLDYFHVKDKDAREFQQQGFKKYLALAESIRLPIIVHTRNAVDDILEMLKEFKQPVVLHCFEASEKNIQEAVRRKYFFSIPPAVVRNEHFQKLARLVPMSQILTETDAPYQGPVKGEQVVPSDVMRAIEKIAEIKQLDTKEVEYMIFQNYQKIF